MEVALLAMAAAFAFVSGANDGGTLVALGTRTGALSVLAGVFVLSAAVGAFPAAIGTRVATTLARGLVSFEAGGGRLAFLAAAAAALTVVLVLSRRGLPTSLTLALTGSIVGVGVGAGLRLSWATVGYVLAASILGPVAAAFVGYLVAPGMRSLLGSKPSRGARGGRLQRLGFVAQSLAYGANDAEKLVAFAAIATGASLDPVRPHPLDQAGVAACFAVGALFAVRRLSNRVTEQMVRVRREGSLSSLLASSAVVLAGSAVGVPLSSTQAATAGLLGGTERLTPHRARLQQVVALGTAWGVTLPSAALVGVLLGLLTRGLR
jgi:PiT family inorganic phosphate transporter